MRVFGLERVPAAFPHHGDEDGGYAVLLTDPRTGLLTALHHHEAHDGSTFDEGRTGLDHLSWGVSARAGLDVWADWLDELGGEHSGVIDKAGALPYSVVVLRDPDRIQLELIHLPG